MAKDDHLIAINFALFFSEPTAEHGRDAEESEPRRRNQHGMNLLRRAIQVDGLVAIVEKSLALESSHFAKAVVVIAGRAVVGAGVSGVGVLVRNNQNRVGVRDGQWTQ